jgi:acyl-coenzyme A thioesterase 13
MEKDEEFIEGLKKLIGTKMENSPSPLANWLNGEIMEVEEGYVKMKYTIRHEMTNPMGIIHGGTTAAILDDIMGLMVFTLRNDKFFTTISLTVDYLSSAKEGEEITGEARLVKQGSRLIYTDAQLYRADGKLMANGRSHLIEAFLERSPMSDLK